MRALFDVNVLIALFDPAHVHHAAAHQWLEANRESGWATSPLTQNGCVRILSQPKYPHAITVSDAISRLRRATEHENHQFWPDGLSILDSDRFDCSGILSSRRLTDIYLLGLAVQNGGRLVTFDRAISRSTVVGADAGRLVVLPDSDSV